MTTRRGLLGRLAFVGAAVGGAWLAREHLFWPSPDAVFGGDAASEGDSGWLDIHRPRTLMPVVEAVLNGETVRVLVDSGAQYSAVDAGLAQRLALETALAPPIIAYGAGGGTQVGRATDIALSLGGLRLDRLRVSVLQLGPIASETDGPGIAAILGQDVLAGLRLEIDFVEGRLRLGRRGQADDRTLLPAQREGRALYARPVLEGQEISALVDTGATGVLALGEPAAQRLGLLDGRPVREGRSIVLGGVIGARIVLADVTLGGLELERAPIAIYRQPNLPGLPEALLGMGCFRAGSVSLDISGGALRFAPGG